MTQLTKKDAPFVWTLECQRSFDVLKERLTTAPILTLPEGTDGFEVYTDASLAGIGCVLCRETR